MYFNSHLGHDKTLKEPASALMRTSVVILTAETSFAELRNILATTSFSDYPLVDNKSTKVKILVVFIHFSISTQDFIGSIPANDSNRDGHGTRKEIRKITEHIK